MAELVGDGSCDRVTLNEACNYDGGDCDDTCFGDLSKLDDGHCDQELNTKGCSWDGGDCLLLRSSTDDDGVEISEEKTQSSFNIFGGE